MAFNQWFPIDCSEVIYRFLINLMCSIVDCVLCKHSHIVISMPMLSQYCMCMYTHICIWKWNCDVLSICLDLLTMKHYVDGIKSFREISMCKLRDVGRNELSLTGCTLKRKKNFWWFVYLPMCFDLNHFF